MFKKKIQELNDKFYGRITKMSYKIADLESEVKRKTTVVQQRWDPSEPYIVYYNKIHKPDVSVVDAVKLILDHLGLEVVENETLSLAEKKEDKDG